MYREQSEQDERDFHRGLQEAGERLRAKGIDPKTRLPLKPAK